MPSPSAIRRTEIDPALPAAGQVYERLHSAIVALELAPGTVINRAELQDRFKLSSTPIRDALLRLAEEELIDIFPQSATRVSLIDVARARQAQFLRRSIEIEVVKTLAEGADKSVVDVLRDIIEQQQSLARQTDFTRFDALDREFHRRMYEAAGVHDLYALVRQQSGHIDRIRRLHLPVAGKMQEIVRDRGLIAKAIAAGDAEAAQTRLRSYLSRSLAYSPALKEKYPDYFS